MRKIKKVIGTGGYLSRYAGKDNPMKTAVIKNTGTEIAALLPEKPRYFIDREYLMPLLGNLVYEYPKEAVKLCLENLAEIL